jgi:hypothetical protein
MTGGGGNGVLSNEQTRYKNEIDSIQERSGYRGTVPGDTSIKIKGILVGKENPTRR